MANKKERILITLYFSVSGTGSGETCDDPRAIIKNDSLCEIKANWVVGGCDVIVTSPVVGITDLIVGDDYDEDGFCLAADVDLNVPGVYRGLGDYIDGPGKYYGETDNLSLFFNGMAESGSFILVLKGYEV